MLGLLQIIEFCFNPGIDNLLTHERLKMKKQNDPFPCYAEELGWAGPMAVAS